MRNTASVWVVIVLVAASSITNAFVIQLCKRILSLPSQTSEEEKRPNEWNDAHLAHGWMEVHEEDSDELLESEAAAAIDAHDDPDPGMEAAAEERAVMLAAEFAHKLKLKKQQEGST